VAEALNAKGLRVWYADYSVKVGDPLTALLDFVLSRSRMGIVIVSPQFLQQCWRAQELNALASREVNGKKVILPVWHKVSFRGVFDYSPVLADTVAIRTSKGWDYTVQRIMDSATSVRLDKTKVILMVNLRANVSAKLCLLVQNNR
jgi:hypothetical protein